MGYNLKDKRIEVLFLRQYIKDIKRNLTLAEKRAETELKHKAMASVTIKGETYHSMEELEDAYVCDKFSLETYDKYRELLEELQGIDWNTEKTPNQILVDIYNEQLRKLKNELKDVLAEDIEE